VPIGSKAAYIKVIIRCLECLDCKRILQEEIPFANGRKRYTKAFQRYVLELSNVKFVFFLSNSISVTEKTPDFS
jgi:polyferredoxin